MLDRALREIDGQKNELAAFLQELVKFQSVSGNELEVQEWLRDQLESWKVFDRVDFWYVENKRPNIVAVIEGEKRDSHKGLILNGHVDVVPVLEKEKEKWSTDPWAGEIKGDRLYGRGASDMKGGDVALLWAAKVLGESGMKPEHDLTIELVVGEEEGNALGTKAAIERGYRADFAVFPEPSNLEIKVATVGAFGLRISVDGKEIHTGLRNRMMYPHPFGTPVGNDVGVDAIEKMMKLISALRQLEHEWAFKWNHTMFTSETSGLGCSLINIGTVKGGDSMFVVPGNCEITAEVIYLPVRSCDQVINEISQRIKLFCETDDWLSEHPARVEAPYLISAPAHEISTDNPGCVSLAKAISQNGTTPRFSGFQTWGDWNFMNQIGVPSVCFGPDFSGAHGPDESVSIGQVLTVAKSLCGMAEDWCRFT